MTEIEEMASQARACKKCRLAETRSHVVFGEGDPGALVMFVGEGPGQVEDETGRPFVGPAGQLLTKILASVSIAREEVYITNIVKCRPPGNRNPSEAEMLACQHHLFQQIDYIRPQIIVALGNVSKRFFLGKASPGITRVRGQYFDWRDGIDVLPMYHPSYLLRNEARHRGSPKWQTWQDIKALRLRYDRILEEVSSEPAEEMGEGEGT